MYMHMTGAQEHLCKLHARALFVCRPELHTFVENHMEKEQSDFRKAVALPNIFNGLSVEM
jgi:hypothetical protein